MFAAMSNEISTSRIGSGHELRRGVDFTDEKDYRGYNPIKSPATRWYISFMAFGLGRLLISATSSWAVDIIPGSV